MGERREKEDEGWVEKKPREGSHQGQTQQGEKLLAAAWGRGMVGFSLFCQSKKQNLATLSASHSRQCSPPSHGFATHSLHHRHLLRVVPRKPPAEVMQSCIYTCCIHRAFSPT